MGKLLTIVLRALTRGLTSAKAAKSTKGALVIGGVVAAFSLTSAYIDSRIPVMTQEEVTKAVHGCEAISLEPVYHLKSDKLTVTSVTCTAASDPSPRTVVEIDAVQVLVEEVVNYLSTASTQD